MRDNRLLQWVIQGLSVVAFILLLKLAVSYVPDTAPAPAVALKKVLGGAY